MLVFFLLTGIFTAETNACRVTQTRSVSCGGGGWCFVLCGPDFAGDGSQKKVLFSRLSGCYGFKRESLKVKVAGINVNLCRGWVVHSIPSFHVPCALGVGLLGELDNTAWQMDGKRR